MRRQHQTLLLLLLLWWQTGPGDSKSIDQPDQRVYVFSNLQVGRFKDSLPPYPEGIKLDLTCQAFARTTFWYERQPPKKYPDLDKDKLPTSSNTTVPGVEVSVYTIASLKKEDDGRELWCTMDASTVKEVMRLDVVGPPDTSISYPKKTDGPELTCSSDNVHKDLELCWYNGEERLQCQVRGGEEASSTSVVKYVITTDSLKKEDTTLKCKGRLKEDVSVDILKKDARDHFHEMLEKASVKVDVKVGETFPCDADTPSSESSSSTTTFTLENKNLGECQNVEITENRITTPVSATTTPAPPTTPMATTTTPRPARGGGSCLTVAPISLLLGLALVLA